MDELQNIQNLIYEIRGVKVMLDKDLAELYHVTTGNLNKAVKRNIRRFPSDFMFQLTVERNILFITASKSVYTLKMHVRGVTP